ncbi:hypothetical protein BGW38_005850, partial [Lunasporangiospora selenospora]
DAQVASQYINNHEAFLETARFWTDCYAKPKPNGGAPLEPLQGTQAQAQGHDQAARPSNGSNAPTGSYLQHPSGHPESQRVVAEVLSEEEIIKRRKVQDLVDMGFQPDIARTFLIRANWRTEVALEDLLNSA